MCREDLFKEMMSEREDVAAKRNKCLAAQQAFREALGALEALPQQLGALTGVSGRTSSQALPSDALNPAWAEPLPAAKSSAVAPGECLALHAYSPTAPVCGASPEGKSK